jgi:hypothetical protein
MRKRPVITAGVTPPGNFNTKLQLQNNKGRKKENHPNG